jgi:hypothetical protein
METAAAAGIGMSFCLHLKSIMCRSSILLVLVIVVVVFSCSQEQQGDFKYVSQDEVPAGKAVVYLYRPPSISTAGLCNVELNDEVVGALQPGQYTVCFVSPGKTRIEAAKPYGSFVTVYVKANKQYFIRQKWVFRSKGFIPVIEDMTEIKAQTEIARCLFVKAPHVVDMTDREEDGGGHERSSPFF